MNDTRTSVNHYGTTLETEDGDVEIKRVGVWVSVDAGEDAANRLANALERKARHVRLHGVGE